MYLQSLQFYYLFAFLLLSIPRFDDLNKRFKRVFVWLSSLECDRKSKNYLKSKVAKRMFYILFRKKIIPNPKQVPFTNYKDPAKFLTYSKIIRQSVWDLVPINLPLRRLLL